MNGLQEFKVRIFITVVIAVRVTKPRVPASIAQTYEDR